jgi:hypothetical protein
MPVVDLKTGIHRAGLNPNLHNISDLNNISAGGFMAEFVGHPADLTDGT